MPPPPPATLRRRLIFYCPRCQWRPEFVYCSLPQLPFGPLLFQVPSPGLSPFPSPALSHGGFGGNGGFGSSSNDGGDSGGERDEVSSVGPSKSLLSRYLNELEKQPTLTKAWTNAYLTLTGDLIRQILADRAASLDVRRTFVFRFLGFALVGPTLHFWYSFLSKVVSISGTPGAILRLSLDQVWFASVLANWQLWIPFQFVNFQFVPQQFQVLAANMMGLVWNVILSFKAHRDINGGPRHK